MATSSPADPLQLAIDVPPLEEARSAFLEHQAKRPRLAAFATVQAYDAELTTWLDTKGKLSLRLELAQAKDRTAWKPCALPDHPCPQPEAIPEPPPTPPRPLRAMPLLRKPPQQEAPMTRGNYDRKKRTPQERLDGLAETFREARTPSSQRNAKQRMREICREFDLPLPKEAELVVLSKNPRPRVVFAAPKTIKAQPEPTGAIAALQSPAQAAKGAPTPGSAAALGTFGITDAAVPAKAALLRMRKDGWLVLACIEGLSGAERATLRDTIEMVHGQLDMSLTLVGGAA